MPISSIALGARGRGIGPGLFRTDGTPVYIFRDYFITDRLAGEINGTPAEPGPETRVVIDTGADMTISSGYLRCSAGTDGGFDPALYYSARARVCGRGFFVAGLVLNSVTQAQSFGWDSNTADMVEASAVMVISSAFKTRESTTQGPTILGLTAGDIYSVGVILRSAGMWVVAKGTALPNWTLLWPGVFNSTASLRPEWGNYNCTNHAMDGVALLDLQNGWETDYGIATQRIASASPNATIAAYANCIVEFTWTAATGASLDLDVRRTDADNRWVVRCDQTGSTIKLFERNAGVETERATAAQTWTNGTAYRIVVVCAGTTINVYASALSVVSVLKLTYASAAFNQTATIAATSLAGANFISWPRDLVGALIPLPTPPF